MGLTPLSANSTDFSAFNQASNRLTNGIPAQVNIDYDSSGNLKEDAAARTMIYDAENRLLNFNGGAGQYFYDGDGHRVKKIDSTGATVFVYNVAGQLIAEYTSGPPPGGGTRYLTSDHLGSTRVVTSASEWADLRTTEESSLCESEKAAPKPIISLNIVAPAMPIWRAFKMIASYNGLPFHLSDSPMKIRSSSPSSGIFMSPPARHRSWASFMPSHTAASPRITLDETLSVASHSSPPRSNDTVSKAKLEKVV
jgi:hypothetical protein